VTRPLDTDSRDSGDPAWPVLARLPHIDPGAEATSARRDGEYFASDRRGTRHVVDGPHAPPPNAPPLVPDEPAMEWQPPVATASPAVRRYRIDPPSQPRRPARVPQPVPATIAGSLFRLHESLAPHRGLIGAVAVLVCGGLLYWLAIGRSGASFDAQQLLDFNNGWSREDPLPHQQPAGDAFEPTAAAKAVPPTSWAGSRVAAAPAAAEAEKVTPPAGEQPAAGGPAANPTAPADATDAAPPSGAALPTTSIEPGITPMPHLGGYPTTPFPAYSFVDQSPASGPAASVAERPDVGGIPTVSR
jgi:hypothetical protein